jgi:diguanylate cyclase (GGDEF)-like protein
MGSAPVSSDAVDGAALSPLLEPQLLSDALSLAGAFAFEMGEDGHLDFADRPGLARFLVDRADGLKTAKSDWDARLKPTDVRSRNKAVQALTYQGARYRIDYDLRTSAGETRPVREIGEATACADGRATLIRGVLIDRTENARSDEAIVWRARHDLLTRLPNQIVLEEAGQQLADLGARLGIAVHLLRIRLRNLDELAQTFGPDLCDRLQVKAAERLQSALRAPDLVARLQDGDFAAITLNSDPETLSLRLRAVVTAEPYQTAFGPLALETDIARAPLTVSHSAIERTYQILSGETAQPLKQQQDSLTLDEALSQDRLLLAFQPIVHAETAQLHHFEALLRLRQPDGHVVSAFPLIAKVEENGQVHRLDQHVLTLASAALRDNPDLHLAINVSAGTVGDPEMSAAYIEALRDLGPLTSRMTIEMTETLAIDDPALASHFSAEVRGLGCQFAVDDFASGHTSFRNLLAVEADCIKIDGSLVRGVALDENKQAFIRVMVDLAATFGVETVAEMVEDRADAQILTRLGVTYLQGYHFGRPRLQPVWDGLL